LPARIPTIQRFMISHDGKATVGTILFIGL
jgi:hypothetical protein